MPADPRPAASVVLVRPTPGGAAGWETYLVQRSIASPLLASYWVFPGGTVRSDDRAAEAQSLTPTFTPDVAHATLARPPGYPPPAPGESLAYFVAAARELFEEAGILLGDHAPSALGPASAARQAVEHGGSLAALARALGVRPALDRLVYYAHWITPEAIPLRFDTRFFLAALHDGQSPTPSLHEIARGMWITADEALARSRAGELPLHFATVRHLQRLAPFPTLGALLDFAATKPVIPVMPQTREHNGQLAPFLPPEIDGVW